MSTTAQQLADQFRQANDEFISFIAGLSDLDLQRVCPDEGRTVAAMARHVANAYLFELRYFKGIADGQPLPVVTKESLDRGNAERGARDAAADRAETIEILRRDGETAAQFVSGLIDEQLQRVGAYVDWAPEMSVGQWIERVLIGHVHGHMASIRAAIDQPTTATE